jgi:oligopeptidase B
LTRLLRLRAALWAAIAVAVASCASVGGQPPDGAATAAVSADGSGTTAPAGPPVAAQVPHTVSSPHGERNDEYYWLRDDTRSNPDVLAYLAAENAYAEAMLAHTRPLQDTIYREIVGRIKADDGTVPQRENGYWYYARYEPGGEFPIHARRKGTLEAPEELLLDPNAMAAGKAYFQIGNYEVSVNGRMLGWAEDSVGRRQWTVRFKDLVTGELLPDTLVNVEPDFVWANDSRTVLYIEKDPVTLLGTRVRRHLLGAPVADDPVVYEEKDPSFYLGLAKSRSNRYLWIQLESTLATEQWVADANHPALPFRVLVPRERGHEYDATDLGERFILHTNWQAPNFRIVEAPAARVADRTLWKDVVAHRDDAFIEDYQVFNQWLAIGERSQGLRQLRVRRWGDGTERVIAADEPTYTATLGDNREPESGTLRYTYTSLTTPTSVYDYDLASGERTLRKQDPVLGKFESSDYVAEHLWIEARDGAKVPVSLVHRKGLKRNGRAPLVLYGYGAYGYSSDPRFSSPLLSLLDRGFVYAIAHVRGGQEMGRAWYEGGRLLDKQNSFNDFVDVTRALVDLEYAAPDRVFAMGASAGGLLVAAAVNQCPGCYRGLLVLVPFVDVVTTMLDASIPLTANEFDEWGDPAQKAYYEYLLGYSPYDNIEAKDYPAMMVATGLWDSQVQYYEPAKWVARLRAHKTDDHPLLFRVNMEAGHGGIAGRYLAYRETALYYAFLLDQLGRAGESAAKAPGEAWQDPGPSLFRND